MNASLLGKVRLLLDSFDADSGALSLTELSRRSGVAKATVYRLAGEMVQIGLLERVGTDYRLGLRLFELGQLVPTQRIIRDAAVPFMQDLHTLTLETVHLAIRDGLDVMFVEKISGHRSARLPSRIAGRLPIEATATGKAILAYSPSRVFDEVVARGFAPLTTRTVASALRLRRQLDRVRTEGFALEVEEVGIGMTSIAVPVFTGSMVVGAVSVTTTTSRMNVGRVAKPLTAAGSNISRALRGVARSA